MSDSQSDAEIIPKYAPQPGEMESGYVDRIARMPSQMGVGKYREYAWRAARILTYAVSAGHYKFTDASMQDPPDFTQKLNQLTAFLIQMDDVLSKPESRFPAVDNKLHAITSGIFQELTNLAGVDVSSAPPVEETADVIAERDPELKNFAFELAYLYLGTANKTRDRDPYHQRRIERKSGGRQ